MGINPAALSIIKALTFGDATSISQPLWEIFSKTGTTHLVVIIYLLKRKFRGQPPDDLCAST